MLKTREELSQRIMNICKKSVSDLKRIKIVTNDIFLKHDIPYDISSDILTLRTSALDFDDFILYSVLESIAPKEVPVYFTDKEIDRYSEKKYTNKKVKFPLKWNLMQISEDQWVGSITVKELLELRDARLIAYNENTQRPLSHKTINGEEYYHITINEKAVAGIMESYKNSTYISNMITLNIPDSSEFDYSDGVLTIRDIKAFDILDGYHRYVAMQRLSLLDKSFDYVMELRVVCFPEEKAKQFIWQEDQKTKMSKIDSDSMNQNSVANQVVNRLNQRNPFSGLINVNNAIIDSALLARLVNTYFCDSSKKQTRSDMIALSNKIYDAFNTLVDDNPRVLDKKWSIPYMVAAMQMLYMDVDNSVYPAEVQRFKEVLSKPENEVYIHNFKLKQIHKIDINRLVNLYKEGK